MLFPQKSAKRKIPIHFTSSKRQGNLENGHDLIIILCLIIGGLDPPFSSDHAAVAARAFCPIAHLVCNLTLGGNMPIR